MLYNLLLFIGICPLPWMMNGEIFPEECKSASASLAAMVNWMTAFTTAKTVTNIQESNSDMRSPQGYFSAAATNRW